MYIERINHLRQVLDNMKDEHVVNDTEYNEILDKFDDICERTQYVYLKFAERPEKWKMELLKKGVEIINHSLEILHLPLFCGEQENPIDVVRVYCEETGCI